MFGTLVVTCVGILSVVTEVARAAPLARPEGLTVYKTAMAWDDAEHICRLTGTILASPIDNKVLYAMKSAMGVKNTTYFIGMMSSYYTAPFISVEGVPLKNMSGEVMDMIDVIYQRDGDCLAMNKDSIRAVPCWSLLPFMCYDAHSFEAINTVNKTNCGPHSEGFKYEASQGSCYKMSTDKKKWQEAEDTCILAGGHLIVLDNESEAQFILNMFKAAKRDAVWTGLHDVNGVGDWISVHGKRVEDLFNVWYYGTKPIMPSYRCSPFHENMRLGYHSCDTQNYFICEKDPTI